MPKKKVKPEIVELFEQVVAGFKGCWADSVNVDRMLVEANTCPHCWRSLEYKAWSNAEVYRAFGICRECKFAKQFWTEGAELTRRKKQICKRIRKRKAAAI